MRILVITPYFYPHTGGSERYIEELYHAARQLDQSIKVDILTYNTDNAKKTQHYRGFTIYRVNCWEILRGQFALPNYVELIKLARRLKANRYDLVNSHTRFFDNSWWTPLLAKYLGAKSILTDHCADHPTHPNSLVSMVAKGVDYLVTPLIVRFYDRITVVSQATKNFIAKLGVKTATVIPGGINPQLFGKTTGNQMKQQLGIGKTDIVITFVGRMIPAKNPGLVVAAAQTITARFPHTMFVLAGDGDLLAKLKKAATAKIIFTGNLSRSKVINLLKASDILVHPSVHHEGLPSVILEAAAAGCAVIATNRGGVAELIKPKRTGIIIKPTQKSLQTAVIELVNNSRQRGKLASALRKLVIENYNWKSIAREYLNLLNQIR
ncbi:hypothetical protein A3A66_04735 [Microgenomates group bacterium RIFCSPLOWO2_01_FULL_46_13]|nr:MAG: hypothetical protein A3A66_04735 [Microgenomates group bacterium RIFCSPLOWO2_01_FULL_46_13]